MSESPEIKLSNSIDLKQWLKRWDRMMEYYVAHRKERFELMVQMVRATQNRPVRILDLGCGTGSLTVAMLEAFDEVEVYGVDFDPTLLPLAKVRFTQFGTRAKFLLTDIRKKDWLVGIPGPVDAVVSATALHWLKPKDLVTLYTQLAQILQPGGIFLNADHVASQDKRIQQAWEAKRATIREQRKDPTVDDWKGFWTAYMEALGPDACQIHQRVVDKNDGRVEEGMPLAWHFDKLKQAGFSTVDCFWRCDCDAIYGGIRM